MSSLPMQKRHGLAPLEMVLVLPLLMIIMGAIIVFGYAASWKLRTETVARDAVWRERWQRRTPARSSPPEWPAMASLSHGNDQNLQRLIDEPVLEHPVIAGSIPEVNVNQNRLDFTRSVDEGNASIDRSPPIFAGLTSLQFSVRHSLLEDRFQIGQMGVGNFSRRIPLIWQIGLDFIRSSPDFRAAVSPLANIGLRERLAALDRDPEWRERFGGAPDFHPTIGGFCNQDPDWITINRIEPLLDRIENVPQRLGRGTIWLYNDILNDEENPPSQAVRDELEKRIADLEVWLSNMEEAEEDDAEEGEEE